MLTKQQLLRCVAPDETAAEFFARQVNEAIATGLTCVDQHVKLRPGQVLELVGPTGVGKSELLAEIAAHFVLTSRGDDPAGVPDSVLLIDLESKFDPLRLLQILAQHVGQNDRAIEAAMSRFHLVCCNSSAEFLALLAVLPQRLQQMRGKCSLLLIDNIGSYSWQDRAARPPAGQAGAPAALHHQQQQLLVGADPGPPLTMQRVHAAAAALLQLLAARLRLAVVATKSAAVALQEGEGGRLVQRDYLPPAWQRVVTHRLLMLPGRPPVVEAGPHALTHVVVQLQSDALARRDAPASIYIGPAGVCARPG